MDDEVMFRARAVVLADLQSRGRASAAIVSLLDEACSQRRWWLGQWREGAPYVAGLVAQDVQDALIDTVDRADPASRWPQCDHCADGPVHTLRIDPDLGGPDPSWVCEESGSVIAPLGSL